MTNPSFYQQNVYQQQVQHSLTAARQTGENQRRLAKLRRQRANQATNSAYLRRTVRTGAGCSCPQCAGSYQSPAVLNSYPRRANRTLWERFVQFLDEL
jgi:hypothetical protein